MTNEQLTKSGKFRTKRKSSKIVYPRTKQFFVLSDWLTKNRKEKYNLVSDIVVHSVWPFLLFKFFLHNIGVDILYIYIYVYTYIVVEIINFQVDHFELFFCDKLRRLSLLTFYPIKKKNFFYSFLFDFYLFIHIWKDSNFMLDITELNNFDSYEEKYVFICI